MISPVTEKYNREAEQLQIDKDAAYHKLEVDLERWNKSELSGSSISMDGIIKDDLLCHDSAPRHETVNRNIRRIGRRRHHRSCRHSLLEGLT